MSFDDDRVALETAVQAIFSRWTVMHLAVQDQWAGASTQAQIDDLASDVAHLMVGQYGRADGSVMSYSRDTVTSWLYDFFEDDCSADIEDGSVEQVSAELDRLRGTVMRWDGSGDRYAALRQVVDVAAQDHKEVHILKSHQGWDEDEESTSDESLELVMDSFVGGPIPACVVDEDGFQKVNHARSGRSHR